MILDIDCFIDLVVDLVYCIIDMLFVIIEDYVFGVGCIVMDIINKVCFVIEGQLDWLWIVYNDNFICVFIIGVVCFVGLIVIFIIFICCD